MTMPAMVPTPWPAIKTSYQRLDPSVQMIGLQLWLPLVFVILFTLCYVGGLHSPDPKAIPLRIVSTSVQGRVMAQELQKSSHGVLLVTTVPTANTDAVRSGEASGLFELGSADHPATLTVATANGYQLEMVVADVMGPVAAAEGTTLHIVDLAPLPNRDSTGTIVLYAPLAATIVGYMVGMFCGMMGGPLRRRTRFSIVVVAELFLSFIAALIIEPVLGAIDGHFLGLWLLLWAIGSAVGLCVNGLGYFFGRFVTGVALALFVFLNIPSSGGAFPVQFVPQPFKSLSNVVVGHGDVLLMRRLVYGIGPGWNRGVLTLVSYAAIGLVLAMVGPYYAAWRQRRRMKLGLPSGGMIGQAQQQLMQRSEPEQKAESQRTSGVAKGDTGAGGAVAAVDMLSLLYPIVNNSLDLRDRR